MPKSRAPTVKAKRSSTVVLAGDCRVAQANELKAALTRVLARVAPVELDASAVKQIDATSLQLLAAFVRDRKANGRAVSWRGTMPLVMQAARRLGLDAALEISPA